MSPLLLLMMLPLTATPPETMPPPGCPMHAGHRAAEVDHHGDRVMGFDHQRTSHHFRLLAGGGTIEAAANEAADAASRDAIRGHFAEIATAFARGDFSAPLAIHGARPPGSETLALLRDRVSYRVEETPNGARVHITTADPVALAAVHDFLRFQIAEHRTGDPTEVAP